MTFTTRIFISFFLCVQLCGWAMAQSGRPIPTPGNPPEAVPAEESKNEIPVCEENPNEIEYIELNERDEFIERITNTVRAVTG